MPERARAGEKILKGIPVSAGVCRGRVVVLSQNETSIPRYQVPECDLSKQSQRLEQALLTTRHQILEVQRKVKEAVGADNATIFEAHLLVLEDPLLVEEVTRLISSKKINV